MQGFEPTINFRNHGLPLARIKKIMMSDENEMLINKLTLRAWNHTESTKIRTLQENDITAAITRTDIFQFLIDILPRDVLKQEQVINIGTLSLLSQLEATVLKAVLLIRLPFFDNTLNIVQSKSSEISTHLLYCEQYRKLKP